MGWRGPCLLVDPETTLVLSTTPTPAVRVGQSIFLPLEPSPWGVGKWLCALPEAELQGQGDAKSSVSCWHAAGTGHCGRERVVLTQGSILIPVRLALLPKASSLIPTRAVRVVAVEPTVRPSGPVRTRKGKVYAQTYLSLQAQHC